MTKEAIYKEAERVEEDCTYSSKSHLNSYDVWKRIHYWLGVPAGVAAAVSAADLMDGTLLSSTLALVSVGLIAAMTFVNPSEKAAEHAAVGNQYLTLLKRTRRFREIDLNELEQDEARAVLEELSKRRDELNEASPNPLSCAVEKARKGIKAGETVYRADKKLGTVE